MLGHHQEAQFLHKSSNFNLNLTGALAHDSSKDMVIPMATPAQTVPALLKHLVFPGATEALSAAASLLQLFELH